MIKKRRILLLTDVFPCDNYSGALVSSQLCRFLLEDKYSVHCACIHNPEIKEQYDDYLSSMIPQINFEKPEENSNTPNVYSQKIRKISQKIVAYIQKEDIDTVWCPLQGETLLKILANIQKNTNVRTIAQIWDPFEWILHDLKYPENTTANLLKLFDSTIKKCTSVITASRPMSEYYKTKYNLPCYPVFASYTLDPKNHPAQKTDCITIIISGQTYAEKGISSLLKTLDSMNWTFNDQKIVIKYFGNNFHTFQKHKKHVIFGGYVPQDKLVEEQRSANLLYCSYYFDDPALDAVSKQSYPSKIITYISSKTPILIHSEPDCPVYRDFEEYECGYLLNSTKIEDIKNKLQTIFSATNSENHTLIKNSKKLFSDFFTPAKNKESFFKALSLPYQPHPITRILEINNVDLPGHIWNGYDLMEHINQNTPNLANQICTYKTSHNNNVIKLYSTNAEQELEYKLLNFEDSRLAVHSCLSSATPALLAKKTYQSADILHFHLIHNMKLSLFSLIEMCNAKPSVISIHDPWTFTGHCVHFGDCNRYLTGCQTCPHLDFMFPIKFDNAHELWKLKKYVYDRIDVDFVVATQYMYDLFKNSPLTKNKRIHLIPFGIDINKFNTVTQKQARERYSIPPDHIVLFHRAQKAFKGTNFFVDALKQLKTSQKITIITCSETGLLNEVKNKYRIIELGDIKDTELSYAYNACDMLVMPSIGESFGMMAVEAMSCGKPVICFNNTALPSVTFAPDCGIAVENLNSTKLMEAIKFLAEDKTERIRRGKLAQKIVKENYDINIYNQRMTDLYQEALSRKHNFYHAKHFEISQNNPSVIALKQQLNSLTKKIFPSGSEQRHDLLYELHGQKAKKTTPIKYGDANVQYLLDEYNKQLYSFHQEFIATGQRYNVFGKLSHFVKLFFFLLIKDRQKLIIVIKKRLRIK